MPKTRIKPAVEKQGRKLLRAAERIPRFRNARLAKALFDAIHYDKSDLAVWLLQHGAEANVKDGRGKTALWWAATRCRSAVVRELVNRGATLPDGVLMGPVTRADTDLVRFLIKHGANVNCVTNENKGIGHLNLVKEHIFTAALRTVAQCPEAEAIPLMLIRAGAKVNQTISATWYMIPPGYPMIAMASTIGLLKTVRAMIAAGANVNLKDRQGQTALYRALEEGHIRVAAELLRAGAKANVKDNKGKTPRDVVLQKEESTEMEEIGWRIEQGDKVSQKEQAAAKRAWEKCRKQMLALLTRHSRK